MSDKTQRGARLTRLVEVMNRLLGEGGCPWDREQTLHSLKRFAVEEAFEVCDAIDALGDGAHRDVRALSGAPPAAGAIENHREELGDLLFQVVFQSGLAERFGWFTLDDVVDGIADKLERRHPHVFGDASAGSADEVIANWERIKLTEKAGRGTLDGIPRALPSLLFALRMGEKAARVGFDWPDASGPREKIREELDELDAACAAGDLDAVRAELGDVLFSVANLARKLGIDPEDALSQTNRRFAARFRGVERRAQEAARPLAEHSLAELDAYWNEAKKDERR